LVVNNQPITLLFMAKLECTIEAWVAINKAAPAAAKPTPNTSSSAYGHYPTDFLETFRIITLKEAFKLSLTSS
jgi:hypothetical protein